MRRMHITITVTIALVIALTVEAITTSMFLTLLQGLFGGFTGEKESLANQEPVRTSSKKEDGAEIYR